MSKRGAAVVLTFAVGLSFLAPVAYAKESEDLQNQLAMAEDRLNTGRYCTDFQGKNTVLWDGYIAEIEQSLVANPGNPSLLSRLSDLQTDRRNISRYLDECIALVATASAQVEDLRTRLAAALASETAAAAEEAKKKVLSETETKAAVETASSEVAATKQRIQTDAYNIDTAKSQIEVLTSTLSSVEKDSKTYEQVQASIVALESIKKASEARMAQNLELQRQQKSLLDDLTSIQNNAVKVNAAAATDLLAAAKTARESLDTQANVLEKQVDSIEEQVKKIDELLTRISKDSPDYQKLTETRNSLAVSIEQVKTEQQKVAEQVKQSEELTAQAKEITLPKRIESVVVGKLITEEEKAEIPVFKAKKVNTKYSEIRTKLIDNQGDAVNDVTVDPEELDGVKVLLKSGRTLIKVNKVNLNDDGTISFKIPRTAKSGTYTMTVDIPDTDNDPSLKVKISNN